MKKILFATLLMMAVTAHAQYNIIPQPASVETGDGFYTLPKKLKVSERRDKTMAPEAYRLEVMPTAITITAATDAGIYYGRQTLAQMIAQSSDGKLACVRIDDEPRFGYRGLMLDLVRCYISLDEIKKFADIAAQLKINRLHLHLTDDNGWRLEIKKYPKLTEVGAWRVDRPELFPGRLNARSADEKATYGGFYTQKEMRELVKYCAARHITVVPEIEMPAHSAGLLASYPELACPVVDKFIGVFPGIGGKDASIICCAGNEKVYEVYQGILDEVMSIFPSHYIHLGGDEANKAMWDKCPMCQDKIKAEGLKDSEALQGYFMDRINRYIRAHGREAIGWDEVTMGGPKEDITIMGWRGDGSAAIRDSRATGHKFILTPAKKLYLIRYQGPQWFEPFTYFGNNTLKDCYDYEPVAKDWDATLEGNLQGIQGSVWCEFCRTPEDVQYLVFPRLMAVADVAWAKKGQKDWTRFLNSLDAFLPNLDKAGVTYARSMFNLDHKVQPTERGLRVNLSCIRPDVEIKVAAHEVAMYRGAVYKEPLEAYQTGTYYAAAFKDGEQLGKTLKLDLNFNLATAKTIKSPNCQNGLIYTLVNGLRGSDKISDFEWAGWYNSNAEFTVDLGKMQTIKRVCLGNIVHSDICVAAPTCVTLYGSADGNTWTLLSHKSTLEADVFHTSAKRIDHELLTKPTEVRYLKVLAPNPGIIPDGMAREGTPTWMYFDELIVE